MQNQKNTMQLAFNTAHDWMDLKRVIH